jgi:VIT1/CCC1 family predicted Fe2+/Mn2+ transporter
MSTSLRHPEKRHSAEELHARLIFIIGITLSLVFGFSVMIMLYSFVFVTQPISAQAPNDQALISQISTLTTFLTGALGGMLAGNGMKNRKKEQEATP